MRYNALQQAIYDQLNHSSVTSLLSSAYSPLVAIFSDVPQAADSGGESYFPFVTIGADSLNPWHTKDTLGRDATVQISVWSRGRSHSLGKQIAEAIDARIERQDLDISGADHVDTTSISVDVLNDPDGRTKRVLMLYQVKFFEDSETPAEGNIIEWGSGNSIEWGSGNPIMWG